MFVATFILAACVVYLWRRLNRLERAINKRVKAFGYPPLT